MTVLLIFIIINGAAVLLGNWLDAKHIDHVVVIGANTLLFLLAALSLLMHEKALANKNPNVFVRSVMASTFIKLMTIIAALLIYMLAAGNNRSIGAVVTGLGLYVVYTIFDVRAALHLNRLKDGGN